MNTTERERKLAELEELQARVEQLNRELIAEQESWSPKEFYAAYYATTGFMLGMIGAATSLLFNVVGASLVGLHPLQLIKVYLTFPLGERALSGELESGMTLAIGCCLYIATGMVLGVLFQLVMAWLAPRPLSSRLVVACTLAVLVWLVAFYGVLSWLQPLLFQGNWIVEQTPWWVGLLTHLVFGITMALVYPLGEFSPYRRPSEMA